MTTEEIARELHAAFYGKPVVMSAMGWNGLSDRTRGMYFNQARFVQERERLAVEEYRQTMRYGDKKNNEAQSYTTT